LGSRRGQRWSWRIAVGVNPKRRDAFVESRWAYKTQHSARIAAERWSERLGIMLYTPGRESTT
jgi:hypothetical protein